MGRERRLNERPKCLDVGVRVRRAEMVGLVGCWTEVGESVDARVARFGRIKKTLASGAEDDEGVVRRGVW